MRSFASSKLSLLAVVALVCGCVIAGPTWTDALKIYADQDCFTFQAESALTHDDLGITCKSQSGNIRYGWIQFTLGSDPVELALLNMFQTGDWANNYGTALRASQYTFDETTLTYATQPVVSSWTSITGWNAVKTERKYYSANITTFYNANLGSTVTFRLAVTGSATNQGGTYEDHEGSRWTAGVYTADAPCYPYISAGPADQEPPTQPTDLAAATCCTSVRLTWTASTDDSGVAGYKIKRDTVQKGNVGATQYDDNTVAAGTTYSYDVIAYDAAGNESTPANLSVVVPACYDGNEITFDFDDHTNGEVHLWNSNPLFSTAAEGVAAVNHWFGARGDIANDGTVYWVAPNSVNNYRYEFGLSGTDGSLTVQTATPVDQGGAQNALTFLGTNNFAGWYKWTVDGNYHRGVSVEADMDLVGDLHGWCAAWGSIPPVDPCDWLLDYGHQGSDWGTQYGNRATLYFSLAKNQTLPDPPHPDGNTGDGVAYWFSLNPNDLRNSDDDRIRVFSDTGNTEHATFRLRDGRGFGLTAEDGLDEGCKCSGSPCPRDGVIQGNCNHVVLKVAACNAGANSEYWDIWITRPSGETIHVDPASSEMVGGLSDVQFGAMGHTMMTNYANKDSTASNLRIGNNSANNIWGTRYNHVKIRNDWNGDVTVRVSTLGDLRSLTPGTAIVWDSSGGEKIVTMRTTTPDYYLPNRLYVEQEDRSAGVRIHTPGTVALDCRGMQASAVQGVLMRDTDGNLYVDVPTGQLTLTAATKTVKPIGLANKPLVGSAATGGYGLSNMGMLTTIWGRVKSTGMDLYYNPYYVIDDGSGDDVTVRDYGYEGTVDPPPQPGEYWMFRGAAETILNGSSLGRALLVEGDSGRRLQ